MDDYRSKLRSSPKRTPQDITLLSNMSTNELDFGSYIPSFSSSLSPRKNRISDLGSPHKSGYFLRTPSPMRKLRHFLQSPTKNDVPGTPSPHKPTSATDLFGNKSLLDNLDVPEDWDENFLSNFQDDWLMGIGPEDLEGLGKSPLKSPGRGLTFLPSSTKHTSPSVSPFKSPLLTSSPKRSGLSPLCWGKTPAPNGARPITRQRKLFLHSPEKQTPFQSATTSNNTSWNTPLPFTSMLDASSSSALSDGFETSSLHSISSYLKNLDDDDVHDDLPVMPPASWTSKSGKVNRGGKGGGKVKREKKPLAPPTKPILQQNYRHVNATAGTSQHSSGKKLKLEPQFTLLHPHNTELRTHQISLRTTPVTPPNKIKISRDFSQIQTLPSKEQLRIVRNRFTETLNKAVEDVIERERFKTRATRNTWPTLSTSSTPVVRSSNIPPPLVQQPASQFLNSTRHSVPMSTSLPISGRPQNVMAVKPSPTKRRKH